jgi:saccharopine dehydrogenase (NAD+, L-lysine forming)
MGRATKQIGVLGGSGRVGQEVLRQLAATPHPLRVGARTRQGAEQLAAQLGRGAVGVVVDINDDHALTRFCEGCELVVNCAGPATSILDRVALAALRGGSHYVDPGGYDPLHERLLAHRDAIAQSGLHFIVNAGLFPGLSGSWPLAVMKGLDTVERLDCTYVGRDAWSYASAYDIAVSLGDFGMERGFAYCDHGEPRRVRPWSASRRLRLPEPIGAQRVMLVYTEELRQLAEQRGIDRVYGYGANNGRLTMLAMAAIKLLRHYGSESQRRRAARLIVAASRRDMKRAPPCFAVHARAWGLRGGEAVVLEGTWSCGDTYAVTAAITALTAELVVDGGLAEAGVRMLHAAVDPHVLLERLRVRGFSGRYTDQGEPSKCAPAS